MRLLVGLEFKEMKTMKFTFRIGNVLYKQITIEELNNVFGTFKEVERIGSTQSIAKA
ncbi:hypothetical protein DB342_05060 [Lactiplantibacillus plantarum]|nr:hypothetical protein N574_04210 [Lactiplantibacillus plantarum 2165]MCT1241328.1 hypothetical protein [Lactiplantibacillus plantarum]MCT3259867.1 hypothetical protein [Lactiplantibacillus plantarum]MDN7089708.1 hypothetical protein [Lactiplantibacillus plantarum]MED7642544.1 hypothetical protein [Lactiplantibacillus plantarum]